MSSLRVDIWTVETQGVRRLSREELDLAQDTAQAVREEGVNIFKAVAHERQAESQPAPLDLTKLKADRSK